MVTNMNKFNELQNMINTVKGSFDPMEGLGLSFNQLYTSCTSSDKQAGLLFEAIATLLQQGRLQKLNNGGYRLNN